MTTVASTLKLFDSFSRPLQNITQGMNLMLSTMNKMQAATERNTNIDKMLSVAKNKIASAEAEIAQAINQSTQAQNKFNQSAEKASKHTGSMFTNIKNMAAAYLSIQSARVLGESTLGAAMQQMQLLDTFSARAGNSALGGAIFDQVTKQALRLGQDVNASLMGTMSFMSNTMDPGQLTQLNNLAMRLSKLNPMEGLQGASFSLKELMSGDYTSIAERFNMSRTMLQNSTARKAGLAGDVEGFIQGMDELLNQQKMTEEAFEKMLDSPAAKWQRTIQAFKYNMADAGRGAISALTPLIDLINKGFDDGKMQAFFNGLSVALTGIANAVSGIVNGISWIGSVITQNWNTIAPIIAAVSGALALWALTQIPLLYFRLSMLVYPILQSAAAWLLMNWPILLVGAAIGLLLYAMIQFGDITTQVFGYIGGGIGVLIALIGNMVAALLNGVLYLGDFIVNTFLDIANGALDFINLIISGLNHIPGVNIDSIQKIEHVNTKKFEYADLGDAWTKGQNIGQDVGGFAVDKVQGAYNSLTSMFKTPENLASDWDPSQFSNIDTVGTVGKIKDTVDISSEDLKVMRDLAEMKNIQNYISVAPSASYIHNGDVRNGEGADTIIVKLKTMLEQQIASSANGVFQP